MKLQSKISLTFYTFIFLIAISAISVNGVVRNCKTALDCQDFQLSDLDVVAVCIGGKCLCSTYRIDIDCYALNDTMSRQIFGPCPCAMPNSECIENHCVCKPGFQPSRDMFRCILPELPHGQLCEHDDQCQAHDTFSICNATRPGFWPYCTCIHGFVRTGNKARCLQTISDSDCGEDKHCIGYRMSQCETSINQCVCREGRVNVRQSPDCYMSYGERCLLDAQCKEQLGINGICKNEECACKEPFVIKKIKKLDNTTIKLCRDPTKLGDICYKDKHCFRTDFQTQTLSCFHGRCKCKYGYVSKTNSTCNRGDTFSINLYVFYFVIAIPFLKYYSHLNYLFSA